MSDSPLLTEAQEKIIAARIRAGKSAREERLKLTDPVDVQHFETTSERNLAMLRGTYWAKRYPNDRKRRSRNHIGPAMAVKHDVVAGGNTEFDLSAQEERFVPFQEEAQALLNHTWRSLDFDSQCKQAQWDAGVHGFGVVEIGWEYEVDNRDLADGAGFGAPGEEGGIPDKDDPYVERFDPRSLIVDSQCTSWDLHDARYVLREKREVLDRVKRNPNYSNTDDLHGDVAKYSGSSEDPDDGEFSGPIEDDFRLITLYDGYCVMDLAEDGRETMLHVVMTKESDKPLLAREMPYTFQYCGNPFPFEILPGWVVDNDEFTPEADVTQAAGRQRANDEAVTQLDNKRASLMDILIAPDPAFEGDSGQANKEILEGRRNGVLKVPQGMGQFFQWLPSPQPNMDVYKGVEMASADISGILGVSDYQMNTMPDQKRLATEVIAQQQQGGARQNADTEAYSGFRSRIGLKVIVLMQHFGDRARQYRFVESGGQSKWGGTMPIESLNGMQPGGIGQAQVPEGQKWRPFRPGTQWMVSISASSVASKNKLLDRQEKLKLLELAGNFAGMTNEAGQPVINIPALLREAAKTFDLSNMSEIVPPDPSEEQVAQFQAQQAQMQQAQMQQQAALQGQQQADQAAQDQAKAQNQAAIDAAMSEQQHRQSMEMQAQKTAGDLQARLLGMAQPSKETAKK